MFALFVRTDRFLKASLKNSSDCEQFLAKARRDVPEFADTRKAIPILIPLSVQAEQKSRKRPQTTTTSPTRRQTKRLNPSAAE